MLTNSGLLSATCILVRSVTSDSQYSRYPTECFDGCARTIVPRSAYTKADGQSQKRALENAPAPLDINSGYALPGKAPRPVRAP
jgi:hypothetical protein